MTRTRAAWQGGTFSSVPGLHRVASPPACPCGIFTHLKPPDNF